MYSAEQPARSARSGPPNRSSATDNIFSMLADEVKRDGGDSEVCRQRCETGHLHNVCNLFIVSLFIFSLLPLYKDSDVSAADPNDILKTMKVGCI